MLAEGAFGALIMRVSLSVSFHLTLFLATTAGIAQLAPQKPQASYGGQTVTAVSLIANPHRNLGPLVGIVAQKINAPYSQEKIDASAAALQKAGGFAEVQVTVVPEIAGLRVNFLLEPAYYLGFVDFPGTDKYFSYTRLLQLVDLNDEDPYDPSRVPAAESALKKFLDRNGYFQSTVHAEPAINDADQLVNLNFAVDMGKRAKIGEVTIQGPDGSENARLMGALRSLRARLSGGLLKTGKAYTPGRIAQATSLLKRSLTQQHRLAGSVRENPPLFSSQINRAAASFKVNIGPVVTVRTVGARLSVIPYLNNRTMKKLVPIYTEASVDQDLVAEGQRNLTEFFQKKGFSDVKVTTDFETKPDEILVVYNIDKGKKHKVSGIVFEGNYALTTKELADQVTVKTSHFIISHGSLSQKLMKQSADNIQSLYRDRGYEEAKVTPRAVPHGSKIEVIFEIEEGAQTIVANVNVSGNHNVAYEQLTAPRGFQLRPGMAFSPRQMTEDRNRISATYLNRGYLNAEIKTTVSKDSGDPHRINIAYAIVEHQLVRTNDVVYLGQRDTRLSLIKKTAQLPSESPMRREQLLEAESRLYDLGIFDWSSVGPRKPISEQSDEMAVVKVHEAKRNEITYGLGFEVSHRGGSIPTGTVGLPGSGTIGLNGYKIAPSQSTFASPRGLIEYDRRNLRGLAETASASLLLSRLDQKFLSTYTQPHFLDSQWKSLTAFSIERNSENPLFTAAFGDVSFQLERLISRKSNTRVQIRYDYNKTDLSHILVPDLVLDQDKNARLSTLSASLIRDTRDKPLDAHRGMFETINLGITPKAFGSSANFAKLVGQIAYYKPAGHLVFANSVRLGLATPFAGSFVPTSQLFFTGGGTSLRGFPIDAAGPQRLVPFCNVLQDQSGCVNITVPLGGRQLFIFNSEVRFPLGASKALGGVVFYDGGNSYSAINLRNFVDNYSNTVGIGLRYSTPIGPVRIDLGRNLNPVPGINPTQYFITIGQAF